MSTEQVAAVLKTSRQALGLSQREIARRAGVSARLWAEVERGERPNVSLETALRMLSEVGAAVRLTDVLGEGRDLRDPANAVAARAARAAVRRATWTGAQIQLAQEGASPPPATRAARRLAAVGVVSGQALAVARGRPARETPARPAAGKRR
jgi:transcriptional regulator with XRE-family HTH domain